MKHKFRSLIATALVAGSIAAAGASASATEAVADCYDPVSDTMVDCEGIVEDEVLEELETHDPCERLTPEQLEQAYEQGRCVPEPEYDPDPEDPPTVTHTPRFTG